MSVKLGSLPDGPGTPAESRQLLVDWWSALRVCGDSGATTWEVLDGLEREVTECLALPTPDLVQAKSLTAMAMHLIAGNENL